MLNVAVVASTSDGIDQVYCTCRLAAGDEVKVEIDDGAILMACPHCGRQVSLEDVSVQAAARPAVLTVHSDGRESWLEARI
jgi:hypothetical protein